MMYPGRYRAQYCAVDTHVPTQNNKCTALQNCTLVLQWNSSCVSRLQYLKSDLVESGLIYKLMWLKRGVVLYILVGG